MDGAYTGCLARVLSSCLWVHQCCGHLLMFTFRSMEMGAQRAQAAYWKLLVNDRVWHVCMLSHFSHVRLCNPMDCSPPGSSVHEILQARILEWVAMPFSRDHPDPGFKPTSPTSPALTGGFFTPSTTWEAWWATEVHFKSCPSTSRTHGLNYSVERRGAKTMLKHAVPHRSLLEEHTDVEIHKLLGYRVEWDKTMLLW